MPNILTRRQLTAAGAAAICLVAQPTPKARGETVKAELSFLGQDYVLRAAQNDILFKFTPTDQPDLQTRTDMFSVVAYQNVQNYTQLQAQKNEVIATYKQPGAVVFNDKDAPPSAGFGGECFFVAGQGGQGYTDAFFARFTLASGIGYALIYARSFYDAASPGGDSAQALGNWINANGSDVAKALLDFTIVLNQDILQNWSSSLSKNAG
jgi:hypothetical protein